MGFQLKDFVSIAASMVNYAKATQDKVTDFNVGSVARTMLEAPAIEIEELYQRMFAGIMDAIPVAIYRAFGFAALEETAARGSVAVEFGVPIEVGFTIPAGTIFRAPDSGLTYLSAAPVSVERGDTAVWLTVVSTAAGAAGNIEAGAIREVVNFELPTGARVVSAAITSGRDGEKDEERLARFNDFIQSLNRGTLSSVLYAASQAAIKSDAGVIVEFVTRVGKREEAGHVDVYIYGSNGMPSNELIAAAQRIIDGYYEEDGTAVPGYAPAGNKIKVVRMQERRIDVRLLVDTLSPTLRSEATKVEIRARIEAEFGRVEAGGLLRVDQLTDAALGAAGVRAVYSSNSENVVCGEGEVLILGDLDVEWINA